MIKKQRATITKTTLERKSIKTVTSYNRNKTSNIV